MKNGKRILYIAIVAIVTIAICAVCLIVGRGHTVYLDNKTLEEHGVSAYEKIVVTYKGEDVAKLQARERGVVAVMGQKADLHLSYTKKKNGAKEEMDVTIDIPYEMNNLVINLPALIEGKDKDVYIDIFVPAIQQQDSSDEEIITDDMAIGE